MSRDESRHIRLENAAEGSWAGAGRSGIAADSARRDAGRPGHEDPDDSLGAVEGEKPSDPQEGNPNGPGIDSEGEPNDPVKTDQDRIGANLDETEG